MCPFEHDFLFCISECGCARFFFFFNNLNRTISIHRTRNRKAEQEELLTRRRTENECAEYAEQLVFITAPRPITIS